MAQLYGFPVKQRKNTKNNYFVKSSLTLVFDINMFIFDRPGDGVAGLRGDYGRSFGSWTWQKYELNIVELWLHISKFRNCRKLHFLHIFLNMPAHLSIQFSCELTSVMDASLVNKELLCILCKDAVYLKESEYTKHMNLFHYVITHLDILLAMNFMNNTTKNSIVSRVKLTINPQKGDQHYNCIFCKDKGQKGQIFLSKIFDFQIHLETSHAIFYQLDLMLAMQFIGTIDNMEKLSEFLENPIIETESLNKLNMGKSNMLVQRESVANSLRSNKIKKETTEKIRQVKVQEDFNKIIPKDEFLAINSNKPNNCYTTIKSDLCISCNKSYRGKKRLQIHMARHTENVNRPFICHICRYGFRKKYNLRIHNQRRHPETIAPAKVYTKEEVIFHVSQTMVTEIVDDIISRIVHGITMTPSKQNDIKTFNCMHCMKLFMNSKALYAHIENRHFDKKENRCPLCKRVFTRPDRLKRHIDVHSGEQSYQCWKCSESFNTVNKLRHHKVKHGGPVKCHWCLAPFCDSSALKAHKIEYHKNSDTKRRHICQQCSSAFLSSTDLKRHLSQTHSTERPYTCIQCPKTYKSYRDLDYHYQSHNSETPYKCSDCPQTFKHIGKLRKHGSVHLTTYTFKCEKCNKSFKTKSTLGTHMRKIHGSASLSTEGDEPKDNVVDKEYRFKCDICEKTGTHKISMSRHIKTHIKRRSFPCNLCEKVTKSRYLLKQHLSREHRYKNNINV